MANVSESFIVELAHYTAAFAEPDAAQAGLLAPTAEDDLVAVFQEAADFAGGQLERLRAAPRDFKKTAAILLQRPGDGAAGDQVAGTNVAAVRGVVRHHLRERPIHRREVGAADAHGRGHLL